MTTDQIFDNGIRLFQGDALAVLRDLPTNSADAVLTDPPYSSGGTSSAARKADPADKYQTSGTKRTYPAMLGDNKDQRSFLAWAALWLSECWRIAIDGAPLLVFSDWRQVPVMSDAIQAAGWTWRGLIVWDKPTARPDKGRFRNQAEYVLFASKGRHASRAVQLLVQQGLDLALDYGQLLRRNVPPRRLDRLHGVLGQYVGDLQHHGAAA